MRLRFVKVLSFLLVCAGLFSWAPLAWGAMPLVIDFDDGRYPFVYTVKGEPQGLYPVIVASVFEKMGVSVTVRAKPWLPALQEGTGAEKAGVGGLVKNAKRLGRYDFSAPIFKEKLLLYVLDGKTFSYEGIESLYGRTIGVMRGGSYGEAFDRARKAGLFSVKEAGRDDVNLNKLILKRVDVLIAAPESIEAFIEEKGLTGEVVALSMPFAENDRYLAFNKGLGRKALLTRFDAALAEMKASGDYDALVKKVLFPRHLP